jgi:hypothetical protein
MKRARPQESTLPYPRHSCSAAAEASGVWEDFEVALHAADSVMMSSSKRLRQLKIQTNQALKKPPAPPFIWHEPIDVLNAALEATTAVTGCASPAFDFKTDPELMFAWIRDTVIKYGDECRQEGRELERESSEPRMRPEVAGEALSLMSRLNELLSDPR